MNTLDEILSARSKQEFEQKLTSIYDVTLWSKDNRNDKLSELRSVASSIAENAVDTVRDSLETLVDGKPVVYWSILAEAISQEYEILVSYRMALDASEEEALGDFPFDYDWLNREIRSRIQTLQLINSKVTNALESPGEVEEL